MLTRLLNYLTIYWFALQQKLKEITKGKAEAERQAELEAKRAELEAAQAALQQQIDELNAN